MSLSRYRSIVPDWQAFTDACGAPEPITLRVRAPWITPSELIDRLARQGFTLTDVPNVPNFLQVRQGPRSIAQTFEHWTGLFHIQQAVMGLPSLALDPQPGDASLDLCAAPGGKTVHLAELMHDRGPLVAVDPKEKRIRGLLANVYRLGHPNILVIAADGRELPTAARFDRVLVDAPCSAEGNVRRHGGAVSPRSAGFVAHSTSLQKALLRKAIQLTRPGGVVVYSTCTFAPEENEAVVDDVLREAAADVRLEPIRLDVPHAPGLLQWKDRTFHASMELGWRVYPDHLDSGGLFMARLRRLPATPADLLGDGTAPLSAGRPGWSPIPPVFPGQDPVEADARLDRVRAALSMWFDADRDHPPAIDWMVRSKHVWAHTAGHWPIPAWSDDTHAARWRVVSLGLRGWRGGRDRPPVPSSHFLARWSSELAAERRVELDRTQLVQLLRDGSIPWSDKVFGDVALVWDGRVLGRGRVDRRGLTHELGGARSRRLLSLLDEAENDVGTDPSPQPPERVGDTKPK